MVHTYARRVRGTVQAVLWHGTNIDEVTEFIGADRVRAIRKPDTFGWDLSILAGVDGAQGWVQVPWPHYVVMAALNDYYPVATGYMADNFERVS